MFKLKVTVTFLSINKLCRVLSRLFCVSLNFGFSSKVITLSCSTVNQWIFTNH